jgi:hypothetical protein
LQRPAGRGTRRFEILCRSVYNASSTEENDRMPTMSDQRRKRIQAKQRKATNAEKRVAKIAKRDRNKKAAS